MMVANQDDAAAVREGTVSTPALSSEPQKRHPWIVRLLPSLSDVICLYPVYLLFGIAGGAKELLGDGDTGWHLRTGQWILANGRVPDHDLFSFSVPGGRWFAWEWLWDVVFGWMHSQLGMAPVVFVSILIISSALLLMYRLCLRQCGNAIVAFAFALIATFGSAIHWLARPHLFTLLFLMVFYTLLERDRTKQIRLGLWLPLLTLLWTNLHGGFLSGVIVIGTYACGEAMRWVLDHRPEVRAEALRSARRYGLCAAGCLAASLVNPYGYQLHVHIFRYLADPYFMENISEFMATNFQEPTGKYVAVMMSLGSVAAAWNIYHRRFTYALLFATWAYMALISVRNVPLFMMLAAPIVCREVTNFLRMASEFQVANWVRSRIRAFVLLCDEFSSIERIGRIPASTIVVFVLIVVLFKIGAGPKFVADFDASRFPVKAAAVLDREELRAGLFTTDFWGGYMIYRTYPAVKVFIDGRSDYYGSDFGRQYSKLMHGNYRWQETLDRYHVRTMLLPVDASLVSTLKVTRRWRLVYDDGVALIFRRVADGTSSPAMRANEMKAPVPQGGGLTAIAGSPNVNPVILRSQS